MNEFEYINKYFKPLVGEEARGLKDDAAVYKPKKNTEIVISTDTLVEGIHFFGNEKPSEIAKKSLRVNLSDMAAMAAEPLFYNLSLSIPKKQAKTFIPDFVDGLKQDQETFNLKLIGGDLTSSIKYINITISIFGLAPSGKSISRDGAKPGDLLFVSGTLGLSKIGLDNFFSKSKIYNDAKIKYLLPDPRVHLGLSLRNIANSMIDISDGLVQDAKHLAVSSNLSLEININDLPLPICDHLKHKDILDAAIYGGDDYELLFSCGSDNENLLKKISKKLKIKITKIGVFSEYKDDHLKFKNYNKIPKVISYSHF